MATTARLGIDIVGTDRTRAGFASAQRSMAGLNRSVNQFKGIAAGFAGGNILASFVRGLISVNREVPAVKTAFENMSTAWRGFAQKVGEAGLNDALINFANRLGRLIVGTDGLSKSIGAFLGGAVNTMGALFEGIGRSIAFVYDNIVIFGRGLAALILVETASKIIALGRGFVLLISTMRAAGIATGIFTLIQRRMLLFWTAIIAVGAHVTGTFDRLTEVINQAFEAGEKLLPLIGEDIALGLQRMGFDVKSLTADFGNYESKLAGIPSATDPATASTVKLGKAAKTAAIDVASTTSVWQEIGQSISSSFSSSIDGVIDRTMSLSQAFKSMATSVLKSVTNMFANQALNSLFGGGSAGGNGILGSLFSSFFKGSASAMPSATFGGPKAAGGPVSAGKSYTVGENGPETLVMGNSGHIIPNGRGGNQVNVTVKNYVGARVETRQDSRGNPIIALHKMVADVVDGRMQGRYGAKPAHVRR